MLSFLLLVSVSIVGTTLGFMSGYFIGRARGRREPREQIARSK